MITVALEKAAEVKIVFLSKRRPMDRDLLMRPYGRFYHLPQLLAAKGHAVTVVLLSYKNDAPVIRREGAATWISISAFPTGPLAYIRRLTRIIAHTRPDWLVGLSDTYFGILAHYLGRIYGVKNCIDAYDNYESYLPWLKPVHALWRRALAGANLVTAAGPHLGELLGRQRPHNPVQIVPMAADQPDFRPMDKAVCRRRFQLPAGQKIVGYCGSLYRNRGIVTLFETARRLQQADPEIAVICSGRKERGVRLPENVQWLGYLPDAEVPYLLNCMDVVLIINKSSAFGDYSYPVKLYEAMTCQLPVVATHTPAAGWILSGRQECLARPGDAADLTRKILRQLQHGWSDYGNVPDWSVNSRLFERALKRAP